MGTLKVVVVEEETTNFTLAEVAGTPPSWTMTIALCSRWLPWILLDHPLPHFPFTRLPSSTSLSLSPSVSIAYICVCTFFFLCFCFNKRLGLWISRNAWTYVFVLLFLFVSCKKFVGNERDNFVCVFFIELFHLFELSKLRSCIWWE